MVNVAIAGGTGGVGRAIVRSLKNDPRHRVIVLSHKVFQENIGVPVVEVNYNNVEALAHFLETNQIHTVISTLALHIHGVGEAQLNLIRAADKSVTTDRFIASSWTVRAPERYVSMLPHGYQHLIAYTELEKTSLEWTAFNVGWFLEYFGMPNVETFIPQTTFVVDMANKRAAIPGDGNQLVTFTYSFDVAEFVAEALELPKWDHDTIVIGEKMTWNKFVQLAEEARGSKFHISYDSVEKLKNGEITELPGHVAAYSYFPKEWVQKLFSVFGYWVTEGVFDLPDEKALNRKFPNIRVTTVREMLNQAWRGK